MNGRRIKGLQNLEPTIPFSALCLITYAMLLWIIWVFSVCSIPFNDPSGYLLEPARGQWSLYTVLTIVNVLWICFLSLDFILVLMGPKTNRRSKGASIFIAMVIVLLIQAAMLH